jgi:hypothetical protein
MKVNSNASGGENSGPLRRRKLLEWLLGYDSSKKSSPEPVIPPPVPKVVPEPAKEVPAPSVPVQAPPEVLRNPEPHPDLDPRLGPDPIFEGLPPELLPDAFDWEPQPPPKKAVLLSAGPVGIYEVLRERILSVGSTLRRIEESMREVSRSYRDAIPRTRLQLFMWHYPKGSPPNALYWAYLARKQEEPCDASLLIRALQRPRWHKRLKMKSKEDLQTAIYRNGVVAHQDTIHRYNDLVILLNRAHHLLMKPLPYLVRNFERTSEGGLRTFLDCPQLPSKDFVPDLITKTQLRLLKCVWRMRWAVEADLARLSSSGAPGKFILVPPQPGYGIFFWVDLRDNEDFHAFFDGEYPVRHRFSVLARAQVEVMKLLDSRIKLINTTLWRLETIAKDAEQDLQQFESEAPTVPGWRRFPSEFPVVPEPPRYGSYF